MAFETCDDDSGDVLIGIERTFRGMVAYVRRDEEEEANVKQRWNQNEQSRGEQQKKHVKQVENAIDIWLKKRNIK